MTFLSSVYCSNSCNDLFPPGVQCALHFADCFSYGDAKTMEILIQNGAKLDAKDNQGQTPIHLAALRMRSSSIEILVRHGASLKIRNNFGFTPLEYALKGNTPNIEQKLKCIKALCYIEK